MNLISCPRCREYYTKSSWNSRISQVMNYGLASISESTAQRWFTDLYREKHPEKVREMLYRFNKNAQKGYCACCAAVREADFRGELFNLEVHVLIISGTKDLVTTVEDGKLLQKKIPVSNHISVLAAHLSNIESPEEFSKFIIYIAQH